jgi:hypothetical protein
MSKKKLLIEIKRLRLKFGDIVVVRDHRAAETLVRAGEAIKLKFLVPIIIAPYGDVKSYSLKQLKAIGKDIEAKS